MNIEYLKYFAELAKVQHYGKAAKILNISQPGLSHAIKTLEEECGVPLFQREGRNVSLSSYGKELMKDVDDSKRISPTGRKSSRPQNRRKNSSNRHSVPTGGWNGTAYVAEIWGNFSICCL